MTQRNYGFDIEPMWGSHAQALASELSSLDSAALVIEHGAGMFSTPLIARCDVRVICIEEAPGWSAWAKWMYADRNAMFLSRAKQIVDHLPDAALVFIDGAARERGDLLKWALDAGSAVVVAHDTEEPRRYGYRLDTRAGYDISSTDEHPRTTIWRRR